MNLNPEQARAKLVEALQGGKYKKGIEALRRGDRYCCLGVACDLYKKHEGIGEWAQLGSSWSFLGNIESLPQEVMSWLGFKDEAGALIGDIEERSLGLSSLMDLNDNEYGMDFPGIADVIESGKVKVYLED